MATEVQGNNDFESCFSSPTLSKIRKIKRKTWSQSTEPEPELDYLKEGSKVEVLSQEDGFEDALLPAIVLKSPLSSTSPPFKKRGRSKALVRFESLLSDDESKPLEERVKISFIRPTPPADSSDSVLEPNHVVDAFFRDVWWTGIITKVVDGRYWVAFKYPPDLINFSRSQLRPHWDWGNGFWVKTLKQKTEGLKFWPDDAVEFSLDCGDPFIKWFPAVFIGEVGMDSFMVQYRIAVNNEKEYLHKVIVKLQQLRPSPPCFKDKIFELMEKVDAFYEGCWYVGVVTQVLTKKRYTVTCIHGTLKKDFGHSEMRPHLEWRGEHWITNSKDIEQQKIRKPENHETISSKWYGTLSKPENKGFKRKCRQPRLNFEAMLSATVQGSSAHKIGEKKVTEAGYLMEKNESSGMSGLQSEGLMGLNCENSLTKVDATVRSEIEGKGEQAEFLLVNSKVVASGEEHDGFRCAVSDFTISTTELPEAPGMELTATLDSLPNDSAKHPGDEDHGTIQVVKNCTTDKSEVPGNTGMEIIVTSDSQPDNVPQCPDEGCYGARFAEADPTTNILQLPMTTTGMEQTLTSGSISDSLTLYLGEEQNGTRSVAEDIAIEKFGLLDCTGTQSIDHCLTVKTKEAAAEIPGKFSADDSPISACMREVPSETNVVHSGKCQLDLCSNLPFSKRYSIWERIESMEVFRKLPQKPYFRPLAKCNELYREGSAIGKMITFASLVEKASNLQVDEPMEFFKISFDALAELGELGFDVKVVRDRLNELLSIKTKLEQLKDESKQVHSKIMEFKEEKNQFEKEVAEIDKDIKKLEERRVILMSNKVVKDFEVNRLQEEVADVNKSIQSVLQNFKSVAVAPW